MPYSREPGIPGNENDHSRIRGNEKTPPGMNSLITTVPVAFY